MTSTHHLAWMLLSIIQPRRWHHYFSTRSHRWWIQSTPISRCSSRPRPWERSSAPAIAQHAIYLQTSQLVSAIYGHICYQIKAQESRPRSASLRASPWEHNYRDIEWSMLESRCQWDLDLLLHQPTRIWSNSACQLYGSTTILYIRNFPPYSKPSLQEAPKSFTPRGKLICPVVLSPGNRQSKPMWYVEISFCSWGIIWQSLYASKKHHSGVKYLIRTYIEASSAKEHAIPIDPAKANMIPYTITTGPPFVRHAWKLAPMASQDAVEVM